MREFTWDRWIPRTNGQLRGKCFHLMTSSWIPDTSDGGAMGIISGSEMHTSTMGLSWLIASHSVAVLSEKTLTLIKISSLSRQWDGASSSSFGKHGHWLFYIDNTMVAYDLATQDPGHFQAYHWPNLNRMPGFFRRLKTSPVDSPRKSR